MDKLTTNSNIEATAKINELVDVAGKVLINSEDTEFKTLSEALISSSMSAESPEDNLECIDFIQQQSTVNGQRTMRAEIKNGSITKAKFADAVFYEDENFVSNRDNTATSPSTLSSYISTLTSSKKVNVIFLHYTYMMSAFVLDNSLNHDPIYDNGDIVTVVNNGTEGAIMVYGGYPNISINALTAKQFILIDKGDTIGANAKWVPLS